MSPSWLSLPCSLLLRGAALHREPGIVVDQPRDDVAGGDRIAFEGEELEHDAVCERGDVGRMRVGLDPPGRLDRDAAGPAVDRAHDDRHDGDRCARQDDFGEGHAEECEERRRDRRGQLRAIKYCVTIARATVVGCLSPKGIVTR